MHIEDIPKATAANFLAQLGGTLNLWTGISVIVIIEVIDLLINALCYKRDPDKGRQNKQPDCNCNGKEKSAI